jgi:hypothetical protein
MKNTSVKVSIALGVSMFFSAPFTALGLGCIWWSFTGQDFTDFFFAWTAIEGGIGVGLALSGLKRARLLLAQ